jgi:hypothetical protein
VEQVSMTLTAQWSTCEHYVFLAVLSQWISLLETKKIPQRRGDGGIPLGIESRMFQKALCRDNPIWL